MATSDTTSHNPTTAYEGGNLFKNYAAAQTGVVIKGAPGTLVRILIGKPLANAVITVYDNATAASGTKVCTITLPATLIDEARAIDFGVYCNNGIFLVFTTDMDVTVIYR